MEWFVILLIQEGVIQKCFIVKARSAAGAWRIFHELDDVLPRENYAILPAHEI